MECGVIFSMFLGDGQQNVPVPFVFGQMAGRKSLVWMSMRSRIRVFSWTLSVTTAAFATSSFTFVDFDSVPRYADFAAGLVCLPCNTGTSRLLSHLMLSVPVCLGCGHFRAEGIGEENGLLRRHLRMGEPSVRRYRRREGSGRVTCVSTTESVECALAGFCCQFSTAKKTAHLVPNQTSCLQP